MKKLTSAAYLVLLLIAGIPVFADDTDIFPAASSSVPPNVLIIFDNSGTMNDPVQQIEYDPDYPYGEHINHPGKAYTKDRVYYYYKSTCGGHECDNFEAFPPATKAIKTRNP
ncbi:MAG TPA: hypothetical protein PLA83_08695 [Deltaproteobacteria bacterium]|jgi:hypothetical protein|nr:hypothetical protein [Deltaproteobacteria bacterium]